jgi:response regulator RpfG family c-di-GMP phosphodiesterase
MKKSIIICVDDEKMVLNSLKDQLRQALSSDIGIETAESAEEALLIVDEAIANNIGLPLIISDQIMPDMKGDEFLTLIHQKSKETLNIMLSGQANSEAIGKAVNNAKLYKYLAKPWDKANLISVVQEAINCYNKGLIIEKQRIELENYVVQLKAAKEKAEESDRQKSSFLQNMAQEVRTPLNAIVGLSNLEAEPNQNPEKQQEFSEIIATSRQKLIEIINAIDSMLPIQNREVI